MTDHLLARMDALADQLLPPILNESSSSEEQPDPDSIKMFVGQIPRSWDEQVLTQFFEEFGPVYQINVLRNKETNQSRGCCFVTFFSRHAAISAQNALHNIKILPGMRHPVQMKPANHETMIEKRKLFIGMLSKRYDENNLRDMFATFGNIEDCSIIKDANGLSKGCAFITFASRQDAMEAIKTMNQSQTMEGCQSPLVVKFADTQREKDIKRQQQMFLNVLNVFKSINSGMSAPKYLPSTSSAAFHGFGNPTRQSYPLNFEQQYATGDSDNVGLQLNGKLYMPVPNSLASPTVGTSFGMPNRESVSSSSAIPSASTSLQNLAALANLATKPGLNPVALQNFAMLAAAASVNSAGQLMTANTSANPMTSASNSTAVANMPLAMNSPMFSNPSSSASNVNFSTLNQFPNFQSLEYFTSIFQQTPPSTGKQVEGPEGANLFIYHLPPEYTDTDLAQAFLPFGNVVSAKVFIDKNTHLSKCFGFVSYDDPAVALSAIKAMNGIQIGTKRLKVQLKQSKDASKPY